MGRLGKLYKTALDKVIGSQANVFDYGDSRDFSALWGEAEDGSPSLERTKPVVIVWDGQVEARSSDDSSERLLALHLTPMDWALAFSIKVLGSHTEPGNDFRIHIVDLTGKIHDAWAVRMRHQLLAEMPWVKLHAPLIPVADDGEKAAYREGYLRIIDGLLENNGSGWELKQTGKPPCVGAKKNLVYLAKQWAATLATTGDHHDLNNIMGPSIIASELGLPTQPSVTPEVETFRTRVKWMEFLPNGKEDKKGKARPSVNDAYSVLVVDDEVGKGWGDILDHLTGISFDLFECDSPDILLDSLGIPVDPAGIDTQPYMHRAYDWPLKRDEMKNAWLLVLDLHLFPRKPSEEHRWFGILAQAARQLVGINGLAWPSGFDKNELDELDQALSSSLTPESPAYDTALSLLPRLCALRWPSVPILIFSVTGRRNLIAKLAHYGNIFLSAPKPNVLGGDVSERVHTFVESWRQEFDKAMQLIKVQEKLVRLSATQLPAADNGRPVSQHYHVVIALDETGNPTTAIGAVMLYASGATESEARNASVSFQESLRQHGVRYYDCVPYYFDHLPSKGGQDFGKGAKTKGVRVPGEVLAAMKDYPDIKLGFARYSWVPPRGNGLGFEDEAYLRGLSRLIEIMFAEFLPSAGLDFAKTTLSVWLPSKQSADLKDVDTAKKQGLAFDFRYDEESYPRRKNVETIGGYGAAYSVLLRAVGERDCFTEILPSIRSLKARTIPYENTGNQNRPRQSALHWYCDDCRHMVFPKSSNGVPSCTDSRMHQAAIKPLFSDYSVVAHLVDEMIAKGCFGNGYANCLTASLCFDVSEESDRNTLDFLQSSRLLDSDCARDQRADGFKVAYKHGFFLEGVRTAEQFPKARIEARLVRKLAEYAKQVVGNTLIELASLPVRGVGQSQQPCAGEQRLQASAGKQPDSVEVSAITSRTPRPAATPSIRLMLDDARTPPNNAEAALSIVRSAALKFAEHLDKAEFDKSKSSKRPLIRISVLDGDAKIVCNALKLYSGPDKFWKEVFADT